MIELCDVSKAFVSRGVTVKALNHVSFEVRENEFVSLIGPTGCGKTTLLRIIAGTLTSDSGKVLLDETEVKGSSKQISMVFQTVNLLPWRTVASNIEFGLEVRGLSKEERCDKVSKYIDLVGLRGFEQHFPHQLSGGMRQKVSLARALAVEPKVLLMDEPFANLDAQTRELMQTELLKIWSNTRRSILFVTHSIEEALFLSDRLVVLTSRPGRVLDVIDVDFPRPREEELKSDPSFMKLRSHIWGKLRPMELTASENDYTRSGR